MYALKLHVELEDESADKGGLTETLSQVVQSACRVNVDQVAFVSAKEIGEDAEIILDKRTWD